jgi:hypothetical protein
MAADDRFDLDRLLRCCVPPDLALERLAALILPPDPQNESRIDPKFCARK